MSFNITSANCDPTEILTYLLQNGTIDLESITSSIIDGKRKAVLDKHPYPIWQGKDGRWRTYVREEGCSRRMIAKSTREKVEDALLTYYEGEKPNHMKRIGGNATLEMLYPIWREYKILHRAASSYMVRIETAWKSYYAGTEIVKIPIKNLTKLTLDIWAHELIVKVGRSKKAYYNSSVIMRQILDYAVDAEIIKENLFRKVRIDNKMVFDPVKKQPSECQVFTKEEVEALYEAAWKDFEEGHNPIQRLAPLAVMFQFQTGIRIGELCTVRYEDLTDHEIYISRFYRTEGKEIVEYLKGHNEGRYVPLTAEAKKIIAIAENYQKEHGMSTSGYIFSTNNQPLSYYTVGQLYRRYCEIIETQHKSSHKSRKTYISALIDGAVNINTIREVVGHADERTTYNSYCYDRKSKAERAALIEKALL